jgi:hypothetical protein
VMGLHIAAQLLTGYRGLRHDVLPFWGEENPEGGVANGSLRYATEAGR